ncbi:hypothetical protein LGH70_18120 [Hymenobacter sp. BT635]|uniref:Uncharacterized protein n=1 Tax=Hymenobacter nitidus TaxID=2880929 RepID=A0ABS8AJ35_9BACT|nr:hypothetical protein [Hymenobacter nitidus]MCB2379519.1 hypothetical protein [Hymenobacter nitidus]
MSDALVFVAEVERDFFLTTLFLGSGIADLHQEAQHNQHSLSLTANQAQQLTIEDLRQLILRIVAAKREQLRTQRGNGYPMQFYCWHDELAAQLRFSLVAAQAALPFGCKVRLVPDLSTILASFLSAHHPEEIAWDGLPAVDEEAAYCLDVWQTQL